VSSEITCFKAYDIRGRVPDQLNENIAYRIGQAFVQFLKARSVVVGHDIRLSSPAITDALINGITDAGADVLHIGQCGTEEVYFAVFDQKVDGGICVTASHNPIDYNGMKLVRDNAKPISGDTGLDKIKQLAQACADPNSTEAQRANSKGKVTKINCRARYIQHLLTYVDVSSLRPLKVVVNAGNGGAGVVIDLLQPLLPFEFIKIHHQADGNFPNGIPNPLLPENRASTAEAVKQHGADLGIAWDGDFDRCFFFDENGDFIEGYYVVGLLAEAFLNKHPGSKVVHDPRLTWNTLAVARSMGGTPVQSKTGHAFIKERMRREDAIYGGEMSAHHYFKDFAYCDSGMIPWLLVVELICHSKLPLSALVGERMQAFPCSGEINSRVQDAQKLLEEVKTYYAKQAVATDLTDGLSMEFENWRFNLRMSNTEPVVRLNVESRADVALMQVKRDELLAMIEQG
jgi:phosphomannomutase